MTEGWWRFLLSGIPLSQRPIDNSVPNPKYRTPAAMCSQQGISRSSIEYFFCIPTLILWLKYQRSTLSTWFWVLFWVHGSIYVLREGSDEPKQGFLILALGHMLLPVSYSCWHLNKGSFLEESRAFPQGYKIQLASGSFHMHSSPHWVSP